MTGSSRPSPDTLRNAFESLKHASHKHHLEFLEIFHLVPGEWLTLLAKDRPIEFLSVLMSYAEALDAKSGVMRYAFADEVTAQMINLYKSLEDTAIRVMALRCAMHAAHRLDQHSAQRKFGSFLATIQSYELALPVSEMLDAHAPIEILDFDGLPSGRFHMSIQGTMGMIAQKAKAEQELSSEGGWDEGSETEPSITTFQFDHKDSNLVSLADLEDLILAMSDDLFRESIEMLRIIQNGGHNSDDLNRVLLDCFQATAPDARLFPPIRTNEDLDTFISFLVHFRKNSGIIAVSHTRPSEDSNGNRHPIETSHKMLDSIDQKSDEVGGPVGQMSNWKERIRNEFERVQNESKTAALQESDVDDPDRIIKAEMRAALEEFREQLADQRD